MADLKLITKKGTVIDGQPLKQDFFTEGNNDLVISKRGDFEIVQGKDKLKQDIFKILFTVLKENIFFPLFGSGVRNGIGVKSVISYVQAKYRMLVTDPLTVLQFINSRNNNLNEQIDSVQKLTIDTVTDPRAVNISFTAITKAGVEVPINNVKVGS